MPKRANKATPSKHAAHLDIYDIKLKILITTLMSNHMIHLYDAQHLKRLQLQCKKTRCPIIHIKNLTNSKGKYYNFQGQQRVNDISILAVSPDEIKEMSEPK